MSMPPEPEVDATPDLKRRAMLATLREQVRTQVAEQGWSVITVNGTNTEPAYGYTVGLHSSYRHPELVVIGLPIEVMTELLALACDRVRTGEHFAASMQITDITEHPIAMRNVLPEQVAARLKVTCDFYGHADFPALQLVWADDRGLYPWSMGATTAQWLAQPLLSQPLDRS